MVGRLVIGLLVLVSALVGATAGLLLVYSTDLPQVGQLEHYRPSSITELYDDQGRTIGSFALQRRVVASYDDYPEVLRQAFHDRQAEIHFLIGGIRDVERGFEGADKLSSFL